MYPYIILVGIPFAVLLVISFFAYILGARPHAAVGLGIFLSLIAIIAIHPYHFVDDNLEPEIGNAYVSIYIVVGLTLLMILICYTICKDRSNTCCCAKPPPKTFSYDSDPDMMDGFYEKNVLDPDDNSIRVQIERIKPYNDVISSSDEGVGSPLGDEYVIDVKPSSTAVPAGPSSSSDTVVSSDSESLTLGVSPAFKYLNTKGTIIKGAVKRKSSSINIETDDTVPNTEFHSQSAPTENKSLYFSSDEDNFYKDNIYFRDDSVI